MIINLNGEWLLKEVGKDGVYNATVPSCNYESLIENKVIEDPFILDNEYKTKWVSESDWEYSKEFRVTKKFLNQDRIYLLASQIDTIATVSINGTKVCDLNNCHIKNRIEVKDFLVEGINNITILFSSPVGKVKELYENIKTPFNSNGQNGICHIRKPQCHFGWDWGPVVPISGITGDICLKGENTARITNLFINQVHKAGIVTIDIKCSIETYIDKDIKCKFKVISPSNEETILEAEKDSGFYVASMEIRQPELWWTKELSNNDNQPLYTIQAFIYDEDEIDSTQKRIGLRTIKLDRGRDYYGQNFCFILNGVRIFAKGANYIPSDSLINRFDDKKLDKLLDAVQFANMNMIRIWGGGYYGSDALYDKCDERGILVWQDFPFACMGYPFFIPEFKTECLLEARQNINRLKHHASLALWCGNNEIEQMSLAWINMKKYIFCAKDYFYNDLKRLVLGLDKEHTYIPGTPCGTEYMKGVNSDKDGDTHIWAVWHGMKPMNYYRMRSTRFCSEFGFESFPNIKTIKEFNGDKELDFTSPYIQSHQKCNSGNEKIKYYIASRFNLPDDFRDYVYLSQVCQSECMRLGIEHWRRNKGQCNGSIFWQLNDCWPTSSWAAIDYNFRYKALMYNARKYYSPVSISIEDNKKCLFIYTENDTLSRINAKLEFKILKQDGKVLFEDISDINMEPNASEKQLTVDISKIKKLDKKLDLIACAILKSEDKEIARSIILLNKEKNINMMDPEITKEISLKDGVLTINLTSKNFAHFVEVSNSQSDERFSDNFMDILPGETISITQNVGNEYKGTDEDISIYSLYDVDSSNSKFKDALVRLSILCKPLNFINYIFNN